MITIRHTHAAGTIIDGSTKGDGVYEIVRKPANGAFTWRPTPGIFIRGSRNHNAPQHRIDAAATALRAAGHQVAVEIDNTARPTAVREADLAERAGYRADRLREGADRATARGAAREAAARRVLDHIPPGRRCSSTITPTRPTGVAGNAPGPTRTKPARSSTEPTS